MAARRVPEWAIALFGVWNHCFAESALRANCSESYKILFADDELSLIYDPESPVFPHVSLVLYTRRGVDGTRRMYESITLDQEWENAFPLHEMVVYAGDEYLFALRDVMQQFDETLAHAPAGSTVSWYLTEGWQYVQCVSERGDESVRYIIRPDHDTQLHVLRAMKSLAYRLLFRSAVEIKPRIGDVAYGNTLDVYSQVVGCINEYLRHIRDDCDYCDIHALTAPNMCKILMTIVDWVSQQHAHGDDVASREDDVLSILEGARYLPRQQQLVAIPITEAMWHTPKYSMPSIPRRIAMYIDQGGSVVSGFPLESREMTPVHPMLVDICYLSRKKSLQHAVQLAAVSDESLDAVVERYIHTLPTGHPAKRPSVEINVATLRFDRAGHSIISNAVATPVDRNKIVDSNFAVLGRTDESVFTVGMLAHDDPYYASITIVDAYDCNELRARACRDLKTTDTTKAPIYNLVLNIHYHQKALVPL